MKKEKFENMIRLYSIPMATTDDILKVDDDDKWQKFITTKAIVLHAIERDPNI